MVIYGLSWLAHPGGGARHIPLSWRHVLLWGGLRGAVSLALALSLPAGLAQGETLLSMTVVVMLFTLLVQGTSIQFLLRQLGLTEQPPHRMKQERKTGRLFAARAGLRRVQRLHREGLLAEVLVIGAPPREQAIDALGPENTHELTQTIRESTDVDVVVSQDVRYHRLTSSKAARGSTSSSVLGGS